MLSEHFLALPKRSQLICSAKAGALISQLEVLRHDPDALGNSEACCYFDFGLLSIRVLLEYPAADLSFPSSP